MVVETTTQIGSVFSNTHIASVNPDFDIELHYCCAGLYLDTEPSKNLQLISNNTGNVGILFHEITMRK